MHDLFFPGLVGEWSCVSFVFFAEFRGLLQHKTLRVEYSCGRVGGNFWGSMT